VLTPERLRKLNKLLFWLWVFPGIPVSILLRNSVAWVVVLSVYAIIVAHFIEWRQEHKDPDSEG
jgi:fatty acid desaturase